MYTETCLIDFTLMALKPTNSVYSILPLFWSYSIILIQCHFCLVTLAYPHNTYVYMEDLVALNKNTNTCRHARTHAHTRTHTHAHAHMHARTHRVKKMNNITLIKNTSCQLRSKKEAITIKPKSEFALCQEHELKLTFYCETCDRASYKIQL